MKRVFANKFNNLDELDKLLERYKLTKMIQEETRNLSVPISIKENKFLNENLLTKVSLLINSIKH